MNNGGDRRDDIRQRRLHVYCLIAMPLPQSLFEEVEFVLERYADDCGNASVGVFENHASKLTREYRQCVMSMTADKRR